MFQLPFKRRLVFGSPHELTRSLVLSLCLGAPLLAAVPAFAQPTASYDIPVGSLSVALRQFAERSSTALATDAALLRGKQSAGLHGNYAPRQALDQLLQGTGLRAESDGADGFAIVAGSAPAKAATVVPTKTGSAIDKVTVVSTHVRTATKTDTAIIETPQAISVIDASQIADRGALGVQEALRYTAGIRTEPNGADYRFDYATARGGFSAVEYLDGMHQPDSAYSPRTEAYSLERIEVLRGPSSVLYGQGAAGGIINTLSKVANFDTGGEVGVQVGSYNRRQAQFDANTPLNADNTLAGRVVGVYREAENQVEFGRDDRQLLMPSLRWQPTDATDITLLALYQRDRAASIASFLPVNATQNAPHGKRLPWDVYLGEPDHNYYNSEQGAGTLQLTHRFNDALTFTSGIRYDHSSMNNGDIEPDVWNGDIDPLDNNGLLPRYRYDLKADIDMVSTDNNLRFDFDTGAFSHKLLGGIDYMRSSLRTGGVYVGPDDPADPEDFGTEPIDMYNPVYGNVPAGTFEKNPKDVATQLGFYLQDQVKYERATMVLGVRRDHAVTRVTDTVNQTDDETTYRVGLILDAGANLSPYVSYSESFQPTIGLNAYDEPFKAQLGKQWEAGVKWQPRIGTLVTLAAFDIRGTNRLETDPNNGDNQIQQGEVKSRGIEFEAMHSVVDDFTVSATFDYIDAEINRSADPLAEGFPLAAVPRMQASVWGEKQFTLDYDIGMRLGAGVRYVGRTEEKGVFTDTDEQGNSFNVVGSQDTPAFTLTDALLGFDWHDWSLDVNATNLFDKHYYASCSPRSACGTGYRRNIIGTLSYRF